MVIINKKKWDSEELISFLHWVYLLFGEFFSSLSDNKIIKGASDKAFKPHLKFVRSDIDMREYVKKRIKSKDQAINAACDKGENKTVALTLYVNFYDRVYFDLLAREANRVKQENGQLTSISRTEVDQKINSWQKKLLLTLGSMNPLKKILKKLKKLLKISSFKILLK